MTDYENYMEKKQQYEDFYDDSDGEPYVQILPMEPDNVSLESAHLDSSESDSDVYIINFEIV